MFEILILAMAIASIYIGYKHFTEHVPFSDVTFPLNTKRLVCEDCSKQFLNHPLNLLALIFLTALTGIGGIWYLFRKQGCPYCGSTNNHVSTQPISREEALNMVEATRISHGIAPLEVRLRGMTAYLAIKLTGIGVILLGIFMLTEPVMRTPGLFLIFGGVGILYLNERMRKQIESMYGKY